MQEMSNLFNLKFIFENGAAVSAILSTAFIVIKAVVDYIVAGDYANYYKMPAKNFGKNYLRSFIGGVLILVSILILPISMIKLSNDISSIFNLSSSKKIYLQIGSLLSVYIFVYGFTINELFPKSNIFKKLTTVTGHTGHILSCLVISIVFTCIISFITYIIIVIIDPRLFLGACIFILFLIYIFCGFYLSARYQKFNPRKVKDYETYRKIGYKDNNEDEYIVIQDYGDKILSVKVYSSESDKDTLNMDLDHFYYEDKKDKEFIYKIYENVYRWKDKVNLDLKVDDKVYISKKSKNKSLTIENLTIEKLTIENLEIDREEFSE